MILAVPVWLLNFQARVRSRRLNEHVHMPELAVDPEGSTGERQNFAGCGEGSILTR